MSIHIILPYHFLRNSTHELLGPVRDQLSDSAYYREHDKCYVVSAEQMEAIEAEASIQGNKKVERAARALLSYSLDTSILDAVCPNIYAFYGMLIMRIRRSYINGWIFRESSDGRTYAEAVSDIMYMDGSNRQSSDEGKPFIRMVTAFYGPKNEGTFTRQNQQYAFNPGDVTNRRLDSILYASSLICETDDLVRSYSDTHDRYLTHVHDGFAKQYRFTGTTSRTSSYRTDNADYENRRVIHDTKTSEIPSFGGYVDSPVNDERSAIPFHPIIRVFDLKVHQFYLVNSDYLTQYIYDKQLGEKLVLPHDHRDLLDILTTDLDAFLGDVVEGKSAGNVILSKGPPGVGKTLTAEVYSEMIEKPLYSIHSGSLGTTASSVNERLTEVFKRAKRWDCVLLLDEADVFVMQRGNDIELNAIVAEFLRSMEYFDGLLFMTTNRPDDIDDAILSRCAAIIDYHRPDVANATAIWKVMASNYGVVLSDELIDELVAAFAQASGRDIKMLFRLALRVSQARSLPLSLDLFRKCAMFRGVQGHTKFEKSSDA